MTEKGTTHFGFENLKAVEKAGRVRQVFDSVASRYDLMNDLMSFGIHRLWKRMAIELTGVRRGSKVSAGEARYWIWRRVPVILRPAWQIWWVPTGLWS